MQIVKILNDWVYVLLNVVSLKSTEDFDVWTDFLALRNGHVAWRVVFVVRLDDVLDKRRVAWKEVE